MTRLVYLSPLPWASFAQRPHKFVEWFHARTGGEVLWIDPYPTRLPVLGDFRRLGAAAGGVNAAIPRAAPSWLTVLRPRALPVEPLPCGGLLNGLLWRNVLRAADQFLGRADSLLAFGKPCELALQLLARHPGLPSLYDAMDDFPEFYLGLSRAAMARRERLLAAGVQRIAVSSDMLAQRFAGHGSKLRLALNACDVDGLPAAACARAERPVLGYVGTIAQWFDWELVVALAQQNPAMCVRLIGPVFTPYAGLLPPNIEMLPACDHASAMLAVRDFSLGLIPFKLNSLTASVDPIKFYEYRALGLPVLSSRFGQMAKRDQDGGVFLTDRHADLSLQVGAALAYRAQAGDIAAFRSENSWDARFDASGLLW